MTDHELPSHLIEGRRTPLFGLDTMPEPLAATHRTTVWATLHVDAGSVRYIDVEGASPREVRLDPGDSLVIPPNLSHEVEPSTDARFFVQFYREPHAPLVPQVEAPAQDPPPSFRRDAPWEHRGRDLDSPEEIFEMVTRQYADVAQDDLLAPYFTVDGELIDWQALILRITDYWNHVILYAPDYEIDAIEQHRHVHEGDAFTAEAFDRWLQVFIDTVEGGWTGPNTTRAKKRGTGMAWAMAQRFLGHGKWRPPQHQ